MESARISGLETRKAVELHGPSGVKLKTVEVLDDGSYETRWIETKPQDSVDPP